MRDPRCAADTNAAKTLRPPKRGMEQFYFFCVSNKLQLKRVKGVSQKGIAALIKWFYVRMCSWCVHNVLYISELLLAHKA